MNRVLDRDQRDVLWRDLAEFVLRCDFEDVGRDLEHGNGAEARRTAQRFRDGMSLLDDLGWDRLDPRDRYELTMSADELERILGWIGKEAQAHLEEESCNLDADRSKWSRPGDPSMSDEEWNEQLADVRRLIDHDLDVSSVCRTVLEGVA